MDEGQCLIVNLAKGRLGTDTANVLGGLVLMVDEFHAFTTGTIADLMPETRKYGLGITLAHQHTAQVDPRVLSAILGNAGSLMVFRIGAQDVPVFLPQLETVSAGDLINLPNHRAYMRSCSTVKRTRTFSVSTLPVTLR